MCFKFFSKFLLVDHIKISIIRIRIRTRIISEIVKDCNGVSFLHKLNETGLVKWSRDYSDYLVGVALCDRLVAIVIV